MPKSKHRRKAGGKAVTHPGQKRGLSHLSGLRASTRAAELYTGRAQVRAEIAFWSVYKDAIGEDLDEATDFLVDLILLETFSFDGGRIELQPASKADIFDEFTFPANPDVSETHYTAEDGEAVLAFLLERGMIEVDGDRITVPARFAHDQPDRAISDEPVVELP